MNDVALDRFNIARVGGMYSYWPRHARAAAGCEDPFVDSHVRVWAIGGAEGVSRSYGLAPKPFMWVGEAVA